uniref:Uncharacterized protein n=1 Tax=Setaria digitata TaxID=48799 RepID=A0A915PRB7_9BILA
METPEKCSSVMVLTVNNERKGNHSGERRSGCIGKHFSVFHDTGKATGTNMGKDRGADTGMNMGEDMDGHG